MVEQLGLVSRPNPEAAQPAGTTQPAEGSAREETHSQKESYPVVEGAPGGG